MPDEFGWKEQGGTEMLRTLLFDMYGVILKESKSLPQECIFIDNSVDNLAAAESLGIIPVLYNRDNVAYEGLTVNNFEELERLIFKGIKLNE